MKIEYFYYVVEHGPPLMMILSLIFIFSESLFLIVDMPKYKYFPHRRHKNVPSSSPQYEALSCTVYVFNPGGQYGVSKN